MRLRPAERLEIAAVGARLPDPAALGDEVVDAERARATRAWRSRRERGNGARGVELLEHDVGGDVLLAGRVERIGRRARARGRCAATAAPPSSATRRRVVDDEHEAVGARRLRTRATTSSHPARDGHARAGASTAYPRSASVGHEHLVEAVVAARRRPAPRASASPSRSAMPNGRLSSSSFASTTPSSRERGQLVERGEDRARPGAGTAWSSSARARTNGPSASSAGSSGERGRAARPAARPTARRARSAARPGTRAAARSTSRGQATVARARLDHDERIGLAELVPAAGRARARRTRRTADRPRGS